MLSHLALMAVGEVADSDCPDEPALVHVTVCKAHARKVRRWLEERTPEQVDTYATQVVLENWGQISADMEDTPVLRMVRTA